MKKKYLLFPLSIFIALFSLFIWNCGNGTSESKAKSDSLIAKYKNDEQLKLLSEKINTNPKNADLLYDRAKLLIGHLDWKGAYDDLNAALELDSTNVNYWSKMADVLMANNSFDDALHAYSKILQINPGDLAAMDRISKIYFYQKDYVRSLEIADEIIKVDNKNINAFFIKGLNYREQHDTAKAVSSFQTALQLQPSFFDAALQLGLLSMYQKPELSLQYFQQAIRIDSTQIYGYYDEAMLLQHLKRNEQAKKVYRKLIQISPQFKDAYYRMGEIYFKQDSLGKAKKYLTLAIAVEPQFARAYLTRGKCYLKSAKIDSAKNDFHSCINLSEDTDMTTEAQKALTALGE